VPDYRLDDQGSIAVKGKGFFPLASVSRPTLRPMQPPIQWVDCRLLWWGETSSLHCSLWLIVLSPDESECDRVSEQDWLGLTPNLTTRDLWRSRLARKWEFCLFVSVGLQQFFYML
jgi:hypothetical protein